MKIGEFIQKYMDKKSISQAELARRSGVPTSTLNSIINRNNDRIAIEMMLRICEVLECDIEEYVNSMRDEPPERVPTLFAKKYNALDMHGKDIVNTILEMEYERCSSVPIDASNISASKSDMIEMKRAARDGRKISTEMITREEVDAIKNMPDTPEDL